MPNGDHNGEGNGEKDEFEGRTYLYIRTHPSDNGSEPLSGGLPFWVSPDIVVIKPDGSMGNEAETGKPNQVRVTVRNKGGIQANDAWVEAFVADPSTSFTPLTATPVGAGYLTIPSYNTANISFTWEPPVGIAEHSCLLARVRLIIPPDSYVNDSIFDVINDRHVAQRNIHVVTVTKSQKAISFGFNIVNPMNKQGGFLVQAFQVPAKDNQEMLRGTIGCGLAHFGDTSLQDVRLKMGKRVPQIDASMPYNNKVGILDKPVTDAKDSYLMLKLRSGEARTASITLFCNPETPSGELQLVEIRQLDVETQQIVGGLWIVLRQE